MKPATIRNYKDAISKYSKFTGLSPNELILEAEHEEDDRIRMRSRKIRKYLLDFKTYLTTCDYSDLHIQHILSTVRTFYFEFEIELPRLKLSTNLSTKMRIYQIYLQKKIKTALEYCNPKYKAIILLMISNVMGSSEIRSLTIKDLIKGLNLPISTSFSIDDIVNLDPENDLIIPIWNIKG